MSVARLSRDRKRQFGQFFTPERTAAAIVKGLSISPDQRILEPSFGEGSFVFEVLKSLSASVPLRDLGSWCDTHLYGCEADGHAYKMFAAKWEANELGSVPATLEHCDFFTWLPPGCDRAAALKRRPYLASRLEFFDLVIGNPPFGGSIEPGIQDEVDAIFGMRDGRKIKKETYAFFIVKCIDLLKPGGRLVFICSDTILTIPTMTGLRAWLQKCCSVDISEVPGSFSDSHQDMLLITLTKQSIPPRHVRVFGAELPLPEIEATPNISWRVSRELARYFTGATLGDKMVATSGMTIGNNDLFLRPIRDGGIEEPHDLAFGTQPITVEREIARARLGKVSPRRLEEVSRQEARGAVEEVVVSKRLDSPRQVTLPHPDYRHYNKATSRIVYSDPEWVVFWRDEGRHVYTFKKTGNWYLHGVGGMKYFGREGLSWSLIAPRLYARYLPPGYILDSGAPCAFLREGVHEDELFFILGWALTALCNRILKEVLNHTRNIQSKDFERIPYPVWLDAEARRKAIATMRGLVARARNGEHFSFRSDEIVALNALYEWREPQASTMPSRKTRPKQRSLL